MVIRLCFLRLTVVTLCLNVQENSKGDEVISPPSTQQLKERVVECEDIDTAIGFVRVNLAP